MGIKDNYILTSPKPYILNFSNSVMAKRRLKRHKKQGMNRRIKTQRKPMTVEQKEIRKKMREEQSVADKARIAKAKK